MNLRETIADLIDERNALLAEIAELDAECQHLGELVDISAEDSDAIADENKGLLAEIAIRRVMGSEDVGFDVARIVGMARRIASDYEWFQRIYKDNGPESREIQVAHWLVDHADAIEAGLRLEALTAHPQSFRLRCMRMQRPPYWFASGRRGDGTMLAGEYDTPLDALRALDSHQAPDEEG